MAAPSLRTFVVDGEERSDRTYRTGLIEHYTTVRGRSFLDVGAGDGHEARAVSFAGAARSVAVEAKELPYRQASAAKELLGLDGHEVLRLDARRIDEHGLGSFDVVLCFGFLYHLQNPFNFLKRARAVTGELLLLETHVAPRTMRGLLRSHADALPAGLHRIELDGLPFEGKVVRHRGDPALTKGSIDSPWTFWLTLESLLRALVRAGFRIEDIHHEPDPGAPEPVRRWGSLLGFGHANTKVWVVASPRPGAAGPVCEPVERLLDVSEPPLARWRRRARSLPRRLGR